MAKIQKSTSESSIHLDVDLDSSVNVEILKDTEHLKKGQIHLDVDLDSSVNVEILKDTEHLKKGQTHSVSYAIALIFVNQKIAKIIK